jgi:hypothetical protein
LMRQCGCLKQSGERQNAFFIDRKSFKHVLSLLLPH